MLLYSDLALTACVALLDLTTLGGHAYLPATARANNPSPLQRIG